MIREASRRRLRAGEGKQGGAGPEEQEDDGKVAALLRNFSVGAAISPTSTATATAAGNRKVQGEEAAGSYAWLRRAGGEWPLLSFSPIVPEGIKVAPESYVVSLEDESPELGIEFRCLHQFKASVSRLKFMVADEMGQVAVAAGSASSSSSSPVVRAWSLQEERSVRIYVGHGSAVTGLASLGNGRCVASCEVSGLLHLWEPFSEQSLVYRVSPTFEYVKRQQYSMASSHAKGKEGAPSLLGSPSEGGEGGSCTCLVASGDASVVLGTSDGLVPLFDVRAQRPVAMWRGGGGGGASDAPVATSSSSKFPGIHALATRTVGGPGEVCAGFGSGSASLLDLRSGALTCQVAMHEGAIKALRYVGDHSVISGGSDKKVKVWDRRKLGPGAGPLRVDEVYVHSSTLFSPSLSHPLPLPFSF